MHKRIAIVQSNYIPWKGYFDMIDKVDEFVLYDEMQYTRRDWRNRNKIKTESGVKWLTIPVEVKGKYHQKINETKIVDNEWSKKHWQQIHQAYKKAEYFSDYKKYFEEIYLGRLSKLDMLSDINYELIKTICCLLQIETNILRSKDFQLADGRNERLVGICKQQHANVYLSGPAAKDYMDVDLFSQEGIEVEWMNYEGYPVYSQPYGDFEHGVSILDLIFNCGPNSKKYMQSFI